MMIVLIVINFSLVSLLLALNIFHKFFLVLLFLTLNIDESFEGSNKLWKRLKFQSNFFRESITYSYDGRGARKGILYVDCLLIDLKSVLKFMNFHGSDNKNYLLNRSTYVETRFIWYTWSLVKDAVLSMLENPFRG